MKLLGHLLGAVLALFLTTASASADEAFEFVKFYCRNELNYLEIEPITIWNVSNYGALNDRDLIPLFDERSPTDHTAALRECDLAPPDGQLFSIHSIWRRPPATGAGGGGWNERFEVRLNDKPLADFTAGPWGVPLRLVVSDGKLTVCQRARVTGRVTEMGCRWMWLDEWIGAPELFKGYN